MFVYLVTNNINGKQYVGQHSGDNLESYWRHCVNHAVSKATDKPYLYNAIRKYGSENFSIRPLVIVGSKWEMDRYEIGMIRALGTRSPDGYNCTDGGDGVLGLKHTPEANEKNRQAHLGIKQSDECKEKKRIASTGRKHSEDTKQRMAEYVKTPEHCQKISLAKLGNNAMLGKHHSEETKIKMSLAAKNRRAREKEIRDGLESKP